MLKREHFDALTPNIAPAKNIAIAGCLGQTFH